MKELRKISSDKIFGLVNGFFLVLITLIMLYPLYFVIIASVSEPYDVVKGNVILWPSGFTLGSYKEVFKQSTIWVGYRNSIIYTVAGTCFALILTIPAAFALSRKKMRFRGFFTFIYVFTMFFGGGLLPGYLNIKNLGLMNKPYTLIILGGLSVYNIVISRTYFTSSIPESLYEATELDGGSDFVKFFRVALPLAKPIIAVITLYYAVGKWNDYFAAMIYITDKSLYPLQTVLRNILIENQMKLSTIDTSIMSGEELSYAVKQSYMAEAMKYSIIFVASLPMLIIYPFVQKYFVKGVMVGSIKG